MFNQYDASHEATVTRQVAHHVGELQVERAPQPKQRAAGPIGGGRNGRPSERPIAEGHFIGGENSRECGLKIWLADRIDLQRDGRLRAGKNARQTINNGPTWLIGILILVAIAGLAAVGRAAIHAVAVNRRRGIDRAALHRRLLWRALGRHRANAPPTAEHDGQANREDEAEASAASHLHLLYQSVRKMLHQKSRI